MPGRKQPGASGLEHVRARLIWDWSGGRRQIRGRATIRQTGRGASIQVKAGQVERLRGASKMVRVAALNSPFLLGFDEIERALDKVSKAAGDGYPPYNIERIAGGEASAEKLRITLAVAGFAMDQIEITVEANQLVIRGRQQDDKTREYLHRGIAARQFQRSFLLAEGIEALSAELANGLLSIDLVRPQPEKIVRKINIVGRD
jgi:HSP20 family molecular chaperone IbpA